MLPVPGSGSNDQTGHSEKSGHSSADLLSGDRSLSGHRSLFIEKGCLHIFLCENSLLYNKIRNFRNTHFLAEADLFIN